LVYTRSAQGRELDQLERRNKRLTAALTLMAVAICAP
jgi:hypothetical protein